MRNGEDDPVIAGHALISQDLADALLTSDESMERFRRDFAEKLSVVMDAWMLSLLMDGEPPLI